MFEKLRLKILSLGLTKDKGLLLSTLGLTVIISIWAMSSSRTSETPQSVEIGASIPKGFSIIPLELSNAQSLSGLINKNAVLDIFANRQKTPLIENLRVLKLSAGEGPLFGALIPENLLNDIQSRLTLPGLRGILKPTDSGATRIYFTLNKEPLVKEISILEDP